MALQGLPAALKPAAQSVAAAALAELQASVREQLLVALQELPAALKPAAQSVAAAALAELQASVREQLLAALQELPAALKPAAQAVAAAALAELQASVREQLLAALQELPAAFLVVFRISGLAFSQAPPPAQALLWTDLRPSLRDLLWRIGSRFLHLPFESTRNQPEPYSPEATIETFSFVVFFRGNCGHLTFLRKGVRTDSARLNSSRSLLIRLQTQSLELRPIIDY